MHMFLDVVLFNRAPCVLKKRSISKLKIRPSIIHDETRKSVMMILGYLLSYFQITLLVDWSF